MSRARSSAAMRAARNSMGDIGCARRPRWASCLPTSMNKSAGSAHSRETSVSKKSKETTRMPSGFVSRRGRRDLRLSSCCQSKGWFWSNSTGSSFYMPIFGGGACFGGFAQTRRGGRCGWGGPRDRRISHPSSPFRVLLQPVLGQNVGQDFMTLLASAFAASLPSGEVVWPPLSQGGEVLARFAPSALVEQFGCAPAKYLLRHRQDGIGRRSSRLPVAASATRLAGVQEARPGGVMRHALLTGAENDKLHPGIPIMWRGEQEHGNVAETDPAQ